MHGGHLGYPMRSTTLYRVLAVLLVLIAIALAWNHFGDVNPLVLDPVPLRSSRWIRREGLGEGAHQIGS